MTLLSLELSEHATCSERSVVHVKEHADTLSSNDHLTYQDIRHLYYRNTINSINPHIPSLKRFLKNKISIDEIDDVVQDVLLRIFRRIDLTALERPRCYLFQAAQATLIDRYRRRSTRKAILHCELMDEMHPVDELHPLHILIARDEFEIVERVLNKLPDRTREIIISVRLEGESLKALANKYNISTSAIEKHVTKAVRALERAKSKQRFSFP